MVHPIYLLGNPELRSVTDTVDENSKAIQELIADMIETMHHASGIGLAAPQIGRSERIFVVDVSPMKKEFEESGIELPEQPMVFINAQITELSDAEADYEEGCLSIPDIHEEVTRPITIRLTFLDQDFHPQDDTFTGMLARVIQHEYDHIEGILFIDHITALRRRLLKRRLRDISDGEIMTEYPVYANRKGLLM